MLFKRKQAGLSLVLLLVLLPLLVLGGLAGAGCTCQPPTKGWCGPAVSDNYVYVGTIQGKVLACDLNTGDQDWREGRGAAWLLWFWLLRRHVDGQRHLWHARSLWNGRLYIGAYDGTVIWISADGQSVSGSTFERASKIVGSVAIDGDTLYVGSSNGNLYALDLNAPDLGNSLKDGWPFKTGGEIWCTPVVKDKVVYVGLCGPLPLRHRQRVRQ